MSTNMRNMRTAANQFAFEFFKTFVERHQVKYKNLFISPFVVFTSLATLLMGSRGETENQLEQVLRMKQFRGDNERVEELKLLLGQTLKSNSDCLFVANFTYIEEAIQVDPQYKELLGELFEMKPRRLNFGTTPVTELVRIINRDILRGTEGVVNQVVTDREVHPNIKLLLVNAILFRGFWTSAFTRTEMGRFSYCSGTPGDVCQHLPVKMMYQQGLFDYVYVGQLKAKVIKFPYEASDLAMMVILPDDTHSTGVDIIQQFNQPLFCDMVTNMTQHLVQVSLPSFALDHNHISVQGTLKQMGAKDLFDDNADLSHICSETRISLERIVHKAFVIVDAKGSTVSPMAYTVKGPPECGVKDVKEVTFEANHPFAFMIFDQKLCLNLLMGYFGDPRDTMEVVHEKELTTQQVEELLTSIRSRDE